MTLSAWRFRLPTHDGELLSSYLVRNALKNGFTPQEFTDHLWPAVPIWTRDIDRDPDPIWLAEGAARAGVGLDVIDGMTLRRWRQRLGQTGRHGDTPFLLSASIYHRTRRRHGLQYCPACLAEGQPWFRKTWRLGFVLVCDRHQMALRDACPTCDAPVVPHRAGFAPSGRCHHCQAHLAEAVPPTLPSPAAIALQNGFCAVLNGGEDPLGAFPPSQAFSALRTLLAIASPTAVQSPIREAFSLKSHSEADERAIFERCRWSDRCAALETLSAWIADWPTTFHEGAIAAGLTQRTFARHDVGPILAAEITRLPQGYRRSTSPLLLEDPAMKRLRRRSPPAYREERARLLSKAAGSGS